MNSTTKLNFQLVDACNVHDDVDTKINIDNDDLKKRKNEFFTSLMQGPGSQNIDEFILLREECSNSQNHVNCIEYSEKSLFELTDMMMEYLSESDSNYDTEEDNQDDRDEGRDEGREEGVVRSKANCHFKPKKCGRNPRQQFVISFCHKSIFNLSI